jgi:hypothetical protein
LLIHRIAKLPHEFDQLIKAAMNVTDDVEGPVLGLLIVPEWMAFNCDRINLFRA